MDVARPDLARKKKRKRLIAGAITVMALAGLTVGLAQLKPAAPTVEKSSVWSGTVKRGEMLRQVHGNGTLVPEQIQFVQSETDGRIERILVKAGAEVQADTVLMELSNEELKQAAFDAEYQLKAGEAQLTKLKVQLESERLAQKAIVATMKYEAEQARFVAEADETLAKDGLVPSLTARQSQA